MTTVCDTDGPDQAVDDPQAVLDLAQRLADGTAQVPGPAGPRAACLVGRQALELVIVDLLAAHQLRPRGGSTRSHLICLAEAYRDHDEVSFRASSAWAQLSTACHHHAYELAPTTGEARRLVEELQWLYSTQSRACPCRTRRVSIP